MQPDELLTPQQRAELDERLARKNADRAGQDQPPLTFAGQTVAGITIYFRDGKELRPSNVSEVEYESLLAAFTSPDALFHVMTVDAQSTDELVTGPGQIAIRLSDVVAIDRFWGQTTSAYEDEPDPTEQLTNLFKALRVRGPNLN